MKRAEFRKRVERQFVGLNVSYSYNEAEYLASVTSTPGSGEVLCQSSPYREEISMFWHGRAIGLLPY